MRAWRALWGKSMRKTIVILLLLLLLCPAASAEREPTELLSVDAAAQTVTISRPLALWEFREQLGALESRPFRVFNMEGELKREGDLVLPGAKVELSAENSKKAERYSVTAENLLSGKTVQSSSDEKGSAAAKAVDGDGKSRWTAQDNRYPQYFTADLGSVMYLDTLTIKWFAKHNRYYTYTLEVSEDGKHYTLAVDGSQNTKTGVTTDQLRWMRGRYLRLCILSCSEESGYAAIFELKLDGWSAPENGTLLDYENRLVFLPPTGELSRSALADYLSPCRGLCAVPENEMAITFREGDRLWLYDLHGRALRYTLTTQRGVSRYAHDAAFYGEVYCSSEEGRSNIGDDTHAANVNDGLGDTCWVAAPRERKRYGYPEWIAVDLGKSYRLREIELQLEGKDYRIYQFQVFASNTRPPVSGEELPEDFTLLVDYAGNRSYDDGHYLLPLGGETARYVAVKVLGNTLYPSTLTAAAGIYDLKVYGLPAA